MVLLKISENLNVPRKPLALRTCAARCLFLYLSTNSVATGVFISARVSELWLFSLHHFHECLRLDLSGKAALLYAFISHSFLDCIEFIYTTNIERITTAEMKSMRRTAGYTWDRLQNKCTNCKGFKNNTNFGQITGIQEKLDTACKSNASK